MHQLFLLFIVLPPLVDAVARGCPLQLAQYDLIVLDDPRHVLDSHRPVEGIVTVEAGGIRGRGVQRVQSLQLLGVSMLTGHEHAFVQPRGL